MKTRVILFTLLISLLGRAWGQEVGVPKGITFDPVLLHTAEDSIKAAWLRRSDAPEVAQPLFLWCYYLDMDVSDSSQALFNEERLIASLTPRGGQCCTPLHERRRRSTREDRSKRKNCTPNYLLGAVVLDDSLEGGALK